MIANHGGFINIYEQEDQVQPTYDFLVSAGFLDHRAWPFELLCILLIFAFIVFSSYTLFLFINCSR